VDSLNEDQAFKFICTKEIPEEESLIPLKGVNCKKLNETVLAAASKSRFVSIDHSDLLYIYKQFHVKPNYLDTYIISNPFFHVDGSQRRLPQLYVFKVCLLHFFYSGESIEERTEILQALLESEMNEIMRKSQKEPTHSDKLHLMVPTRFLVQVFSWLTFIACNLMALVTADKKGKQTYNMRERGPSRHQKLTMLFEENKSRKIKSFAENLVKNYVLPQKHRDKLYGIKIDIFSILFNLKKKELFFYPAKLREEYLEFLTFENLNITASRIELDHSAVLRESYREAEQKARKSEKKPFKLESSIERIEEVDSMKSQSRINDNSIANFLEEETKSGTDWKKEGTRDYKKKINEAHSKFK